MGNQTFHGRQKELQLLDALYDSNKFEMLILHGRRRVGKSYLLNHFASKHSSNTVFDEKELDDLMDSALCIKQANKSFIFSRNSVTSGVQERIRDDARFKVVTLKNLFND